RHRSGFPELLHLPAYDLGREHRIRLENPKGGSRPAQQAMRRTAGFGWADGLWRQIRQPDFRRPAATSCLGARPGLRTLSITAGRTVGGVGPQNPRAVAPQLERNSTPLASDDPFSHP